MESIQTNSDGWTDWQYPIPQGYRLICCDCGLAHNMDFRVVKITKQNPDGSYDVEVLDSKDYRVEFRAQRNNRSTGQFRRHL